jgi:hypothetical protein
MEMQPRNDHEPAIKLERVILSLSHRNAKSSRRQEVVDKD